MSQEKKADEVKSSDALAALIFDLARDHVPFGILEEIMEELEEVGPMNNVFVDPNLGRYAISLAKRIRALSRET